MPVKSDREKYAAAVWRQGEPRRELDRWRLLATETPNRKRITLALDFRELYGPEVDRELGGEEPMVDEWESGDRIPTPEQMCALAKLTSHPLEFFYKDDPVEIDEDHMFICEVGHGD